MKDKKVFQVRVSDEIRFNFHQACFLNYYSMNQVLVKCMEEYADENKLRKFMRGEEDLIGSGRRRI